MISSNALLTITNGTDSVSMLVTISGAHIQDWLPKSPQSMSSVWASSPYQDGKHLINKTYDNIIDTFTVVINSEEMDTTIHKLRQFIIFLEKAILYWTDEFSTEKYWLEVRGECETNIRYALVVDYSIPDINSPFVPPFQGSPSTLDEIQISIEHTIWTDELGVGDSCVEISTGISTGTIDSTGPDESWDDCYITNLPSITEDANLAVGDFGAGRVADTGIRFRDVRIPPNAIITSAWITLTGAFADAGNDVKVLIEIEDDVAPAIFSTRADFLGRVMYGTSVAWTIPAVTVGVSYNTPSLVALIQYIVNKAGWLNGNDIALFLWNNASTANEHRQFYSWDTGVKPTLNIEWESTVLHGETATCLRGPAVQPLWRNRLLTHAFTEDASTGIFGPNLVELTQPLLLPTAVDNGDNLYCGIWDTGDPNLASPFNSLVIHLANQGSNFTVEPQYWDSANWVPFSVYKEQPDNWWSSTATLGIHLMTWEYPDDWAQCTVNALSGYWMRFNVTAHAAHVPPWRVVSPVVPAYPIYTISWPHIQVSGSELQGDIGALINFLIANESDEIDRIMVSARKYSRTNVGKFVAYHPFNTHVVFPDAVFTPEAAFNESVYSVAYTGWCGYWVPGIVHLTGQKLWTFDLGPKTYAGRYRVFMRVSGYAGGASDPGNFGFQLLVTSAIGSYYTPWVYNQADHSYLETIDLGLIAFPPEPLEENVGTIYLQSIALYATNANLNDAMYFYDLILMPVDDAHVEVELDSAEVDTQNTFSRPWKIVTTNAKLGSYGFTLNNTTPMTVDWDDEIVKLLKVNILGSFELEPEEDYWIIFLAYHTYSTYVGFGAGPFQCLIAPSLDKNQRYLLARGDE